MGDFHSAQKFAVRFMNRKPLLLVLTLCFCLSCAQESSKINGISLVAPRNAMNKDDIQDIKEFSPNYVAIIPYGFIRNLNDPQIRYNVDGQWWGELEEGVNKTIDLLHEGAMQAMLKPHIWIWRGEYTGHLKMQSEEAWQKLEQSHREYVTYYAQIAQEKKIGIFCIGTELDSFVQERPDYWQSLIQEIRSVYDGKLTYAGNWDTYDDVPFLNELDFIGVDAYFPVSDEKTPTAQSIDAGWEKWKFEMSSLSRKRNKPILLTEYGYTSADYAGREPWKSATDSLQVNEKAQKMLLEGLYRNLWQEDWLAGGFLWKHFPAEFLEGDRGFEKLFNVQNKEAAQTVQQQYKKK